MKAHTKTLWACDVLRHRILTPKGFKDAYLLVFIHLASRRAYASVSTMHPNAAWSGEQARAFAQAHPEATGAALIVRDRDLKFGQNFDEALDDHGTAPVRIPHCSPNLNAYAEQLIQSVQDECLDKFMVMGTQHLDYLVSEYVVHYNIERPHSAIGFRTPSGDTLSLASDGPLRCTTRLGGVLRHYWRMAA